MKKTASTLMAIAMSLGSFAFAEDKAPDRQGFAPDANPNVNPPPGAVQDPGGQRPPPPPTFEQWVENGKRIPPGNVFAGGSPWFDESTGKDRNPEEVYKIIFPERPEPGTGGPDPRPEVEQPEKPDPVAEYKHLERLIAEKKEFGSRAKFTEEGFEQFQRELRAMEGRLAELCEIPEVVICIFPPRPEPRPFPPHWGRPPAIQTKDLRPLPEGFEGMGSSTLCAWIAGNVKSDLANKDKPKPEPKRPPVVRPPAPPRPELSDEVKTELAGIESDKKALMKEMKAKLAELDEDASREDARKAVEEFKKDNEARFASIKKAADKVHEELKAKRPERKERPEPPAAVKAKIAEVKKVEKTLHFARKAVSDKLKEAQDELAAKIAEAKENADKEEVAINIKRLVAEQAAARKAALDHFRAAQKEKHEELKAAQKELRKEVRDTKEEGSSRTSR
jgi:hypothetical protein